ncbi:MAG: HAMP domain-containing histidine kinase [Parcubacteria group bacterium]|nr:HAMP domain-containing histidine kinase [Parcubacteria group bacterium]
MDAEENRIPDEGLIKENLLTLSAGLLIGAYAGIAFVAFFVYEVPTRDIEALSVFFSAVSSSTKAFFQFLILFTAFALLGALASYALVLTRTVNKLRREVVVVRTVDKSKDQFISMVLHHIRTPLAGIKWSIKEAFKEAEKQSLGNDGVKSIQDVLLENERVLTAVEHLIEASQASMGRVTYNFKVVPVQDVVTRVKEIVTSLEALVTAKGISLRSDIKVASNSSVKVDMEKVAIVVQTLFENAVSYSDPGGSIAVETEEVASHFIFRITDTGIGIPKEDQAKIFQQFFRTESARRKDPGGFGVGLFIVKTFLKEHGGDIWFTSESGKGTTFSFKIPLITSETEKHLEKL